MALALLAPLASSQKSPDTRLDRDPAGSATSQHARVSAAADTVYAVWQDLCTAARNGDTRVSLSNEERRTPLNCAVSRRVRDAGLSLVSSRRGSQVRSKTSSRVVAVSPRVAHLVEVAHRGAADTLDHVFREGAEAALDWLVPDLSANVPLNGVYAAPQGHEIRVQ